MTTGPTAADHTAFFATARPAANTTPSDHEPPEDAAGPEVSTSLAEPTDTQDQNGPESLVLSKMLDKVEQLEFVCVEGRESSLDVLHRLTEVVHLLQQFEGKHAQQVSQGSTGDAASKPEGIEDPLALLQAALTAQSAERASLSAAMTSLIEKVGALEPLLQRAQTQDSEPRDGEGFTRDIDGPLTALNQSVEKLQDLPDQIPALAAKLSDIADRLQAPPAAGPENLEQSIQKAVNRALDIRFEEIQSQLQETMQSQLGELRAAFAAPASLEVEPIAEAVATSLREALDPMQEKLVAGLEVVSEQPAPELDLTEQREGFAKFSSILGHVAGRLEGVAQTFEARSDDGTVETIAHAVRPLEEKLTQVASDWTASLEALKADVQVSPDQSALPLDALETRLSALEEKIDLVAQRPDPVLDLTAQQQGFARFSSVLGHVVGRLEDAAAVVERAASEADNATSDSGLEQVQTTLAQFIADFDAKFGTVEVPETSDSDGSADTALTASLKSLEEKLDMIGQRPDPVLDLTEQRQGFAKFTSILGHVAGRLEGVASVFEKGTSGVITEGQGVDIEDLQATLQEIATTLSGKIDTLAQTAAEDAPAPETGEATATLHTAIGTLDGKIDLIAQRPDPVLDLTAQQQGFAAFHSSTATFLRRLEAAATSMSTEFDRMKQHAEDGAEMPKGDVDQHPTSAHLADAIKSLSSANEVLAARLPYDSSKHHDEQERFLRELRAVLADFIASVLREQHLQSEPVSADSDQ